MILVLTFFTGTISKFITIIYYGSKFIQIEIDELDDVAKWAWLKCTFYLVGPNINRGHTVLVDVFVYSNESVF